MWYKQFKKVTLAGEDEMPKTFLTPGMAATGKKFSNTTAVRYHPTGFPRFCSSSHFFSGAK